MKFLKITVNWIFLFTLFPIIYALHILELALISIKDAVFDFVHELMHFNNQLSLFRPTKFLASRKPWLLEGRLWFFETLKKNKKNKG